MKSSTVIRPMIEAMMPARIESEPSEGPTERSSTTLSLAGKAPERRTMARSVASWVVKRPEIWPEPPRIGSLIRGRRDDLVVEHDGKGPADIVAGELAELECALLVEAEADDRLAVAAVESRLGIVQVLAIDGGAARGLDPVDLVGLLLVRQGFAIGRRPFGWRWSAGCRTAAGTAAWRSGRGDP